jgi:hypothetical protein
MVSAAFAHPNVSLPCANDPVPAVPAAVVTVGWVAYVTIAGSHDWVTGYALIGCAVHDPASISYRRRVAAVTCIPARLDPAANRIKARRVFPSVVFPTRRS